MTNRRPDRSPTEVAPNFAITFTEPTDKRLPSSDPPRTAEALDMDANRQGPVLVPVFASPPRENVAMHGTWRG